MKRIARAMTSERTPDRACCASAEVSELEPNMDAISAADDLRCCGTVFLRCESKLKDASCK